MGNLKEDFFPGINRKNKEVKQEEARKLKLLQQQRIAEQKKQAKKATIRKNIILAIESYLIIVNILGASYAYDKLAVEKGAEKHFHKDAGMDYVFEDHESRPTIGEVFERMGETPENIFFPTWIFDDDEMRRN